jgi:hypothetical protein
MPGGPKEAYDLIAPIMMGCAAQAGEPSTACSGYLGPIGAGNYVKTVHNGIEYGDMQLISEAYDILKVCVRKFYCTKYKSLIFPGLDPTHSHSFTHFFYFPFRQNVIGQRRNVQSSLPKMEQGRN